MTEPDGARRRRVAPFVALAVALVVAGLFVVLAGADPARNETADTQLLDRPAPAASGVLADGTTFDLSRRKGSWVVLNFFTSNCAPCRREHPELLRFVEQQGGLGADGAELYTIAVGGEPHDVVEEYFADNGGDWPVVFDGDGRFSVAFGVSKVPETWVIDPDGVVRARVISEVTAEFLSSSIQRGREQR
ncbi:MAG TPA: TlpA disulfide reductase family protein [Ilumatobacteraceae bacterium]|nr:TlpA disulfide reductase family protein [Ilumatobacteraceae bacterium]